MPSFDVVNELNYQEIDNAVNQTAKEILSRFDFKGTESEIEFLRKDKKINLKSNSEQKIENLFDVLQSKIIKRGVDVKCLKKGKIEAMGGQTQRCIIELLEGIDKDTGKVITNHVKNTKFKAQASIHDDKVRVTSKSIDELQAIIASLKTLDVDRPLQFNNFRD